MIKRFEDIVAWQKARELTLAVYSKFESCNDFAFRNQIQRAAVSVMNNIAEGYERRTDNEFRQYLYIAKGSCGEVRSMLYVAKDLKYIDEKSFNYMFNLATETSKVISGFIKTLN